MPQGGHGMTCGGRPAAPSTCPPGDQVVVLGVSELLEGCVAVRTMSAPGKRLRTGSRDK